jgi:Flp pilus assembly protein TadG
MAAEATPRRRLIIVIHAFRGAADRASSPLGDSHRVLRAFRRRGAAAVEFAVIGSVFFVFVLGFIELGRGFMVQHLMTNAARQGCRVAVIEGKTNTDVTNAVVSVLGGEGISGDTVSVQVKDAAANASTAQSGDEISVTVSIPTSTVSWVPAANFLVGTISGKYTMRRE